MQMQRPPLEEPHAGRGHGQNIKQHPITVGVASLQFLQPHTDWPHSHTGTTAPGLQERFKPLPSAQCCYEGEGRSWQGHRLTTPLEIKSGLLWTLANTYLLLGLIRSVCGRDADVLSL